MSWLFLLKQADLTESPVSEEREIRLHTKNRPVLDSLSFWIVSTGLLGALALVLGALENTLPPIPLLPSGAKFGLFNIASMYANLMAPLCFVYWLFLRIQFPLFGYCGIGILGALTLQLTVAFALTSSAVVVYIPWFILFAVLSGILTCLVLKVILPLLNTISLPKYGKTL